MYTQINNDDYTSTLHYTGNHTFAAVKAGEEYLVIKEAFAPVLEEINNLIAAGKVLVDGSEVPLQFVFGSDYKVIPDLVDVIVIVLTELL